MPFIALLLLFSCSKENTKLEQLKVDPQTVFGEDPAFDNHKPIENNISPETFLNRITLENDYLVFEDNTHFFETIQFVDEQTVSEWAEKVNFISKKVDVDQIIKSIPEIKDDNIEKSIIQIPFMGYYKVLNSDGIAKVGKDLYKFEKGRLIVIKGGDLTKLNLANRLQSTDEKNGIFIEYYQKESNSNARSCDNDGEPFFLACSKIQHFGSHSLVSILGIDGYTVAIPVAGGFGYDFSVYALTSVNGAQTPVDLNGSVSYFRAKLKHGNTTVYSNPYTQQGIPLNMYNNGFLNFSIMSGFVPGASATLSTQMGLWASKSLNDSSIESKCTLITSRNIFCN